MNNFSRPIASSSSSDGGGNGDNNSHGGDVGRYSRVHDAVMKIINMRIVVLLFNNGTHGAFPRELLELKPWECSESQFKLYEEWMVGVVFIGGWYGKALIEQGGMDSQLLFMDRVKKILQNLEERFRHVEHWCTPGQGKCVTLWSIVNQSLAVEFGMHRELVRVFAELNGMIVEPVEGLGGGQYRESQRIQIRVVPSFMFLSADEFVGYQEISYHYLITHRVNAVESAVVAHDQDMLMDFQRPAFEMPVTYSSSAADSSRYDQHMEDQQLAAAQRASLNDFHASRSSASSSADLEQWPSESNRAGRFVPQRWNGAQDLPSMPYGVGGIHQSDSEDDMVHSDMIVESSDSVEVQHQQDEPVAQHHSALRPFNNSRKKRYLPPPSPHHRISIAVDEDDDVVASSDAEDAIDLSDSVVAFSVASNSDGAKKKRHKKSKK